MGTRNRVLSGTLGLALALTACGGDEGAPPGEEGADAEASAAADADSTEEEPAAASTAEVLDPEDGWNGLHDGLDLPPPGDGLLVVDGERIDLEVMCTDGGGPRTSPGDGPIFSFHARGSGVDAQGREMYVDVVRRLVSVEEGEQTVYEYTGQEYGSVQIVVALEDGSGAHSSIVVTPADADPAGTKLPLVRVDESGSFTVVEDVPPLSVTIHDQALHGAVELAGSCQSGWLDEA